MHVPLVKTADRLLIAGALVAALGGSGAGAGAGEATGEGAVGTGSTLPQAVVKTNASITAPTHDRSLTQSDSAAFLPYFATV